MYKLLLCHCRSPDLDRRAFQARWRDQRRQLVFDLQSKLGFHQYAQVHQVSRWNLIDRGVRASRSWFATAPFIAFQGREVPPLWGPDRPVKPGGPWDVVEALAYPSKDALVEALTRSSGREGVRRLAEDHACRTQRTIPLVAESFVAAPDQDPTFPRISVTFFLRSRTGMTREAMLEYWGTSHKELCVSLQKDLSYVEYEQLHVRSAPDVSPLIEDLGEPMPDPYDGVAKLTYTDLRTLGLGFLNPVTLVGNTRLVRDETTFADAQHSALVLGREFRFRSSKESPGKSR